MKPDPTVTVILPTYNRAALLDRAIRSVLDQSCTDFELLVIDDGSTDDTESVLRRLADPRIRYLRQPQNRGAAAARNVGLRQARGRFIAFQDSDDLWRPDKLQKQLAHFEPLDPRVGVVYCGFWRIGPHKKVYIPGPQVKHRSGDLHHQLLQGNFITGQAALVRRECFQTSGLFDESLRSRHDWDLWLRISKHWRFAFMPEPLVTLYETPDSISATQNVSITGWKPLLEKHHNEFRKYPRLLARHYLEIAVKADMLQPQWFYERRKFLFKALSTWPFVSPKYHILALISLLGPSVFARLIGPFVKNSPKSDNSP